MIENSNEVLNNTTPEVPVGVQQTPVALVEPTPQVEGQQEQGVRESALNETEEEKLRKEMEVGEHDIVIEEDFQIDLDVADVNDSFAAVVSNGAMPEEAPKVELATEQSGNITF